MKTRMRIRRTTVGSQGPERRVPSMSGSAHAGRIKNTEEFENPEHPENTVRLENIENTELLESTEHHKNTEYQYLEPTENIENLPPSRPRRQRRVKVKVTVMMRAMKVKTK